MKKKPAPRLPQIGNIKLAVSANFSFVAEPGDLGPAGAVLSWLNRRTGGTRSADDLGRHLDGLRARTAGESATRRAAEKALDLKLLRMATIWVREFGFCTFDLDGIMVSVDIFNAADELRLGDQARNVVELFRVQGREVTPLVNAAKELMDETDVGLVFGGPSFSFETFVEFREEGPTTRRGALGVSDFLWPLMGLRKEYAEETLAGLPVHRLLRARNGLIVQTFEDLWTGDEARYDEAAHRLGLTSFWEVQHFPKKR